MQKAAQRLCSPQAPRPHAFIFIALSLVFAVLLPIQSANSNPPPSPDEACAGCHKEQSLSYIHTAHHLTSQPAGAASLRAAFTGSADRLTISDGARGGEPSLSFLMEAKDGRYSETAVTGFADHLQQRRESIDVVIGSGKRGQSYLYWSGNQLFELPVSYWTDGHRWINSPGYDDGTADFSRPVNPGCLECHATSIKALSTDPLTNRYEKDSLVTGIHCQTCHGPGDTHIALEQSGRQTAHAILNPAHFSRDRQLDLCALCHNGTQRQELVPAFSYTPGEPLAKYFKSLASPAEHPDVHGNQVGLLERSRCFLSSTMTCSTCHNVHAPERTAASYSQQCLHCHQWQSCGVSKTLGKRISDNCIDCHMPVEQTTLIVSETAGSEVRASMRSHWIKAYTRK